MLDLSFLVMRSNVVMVTVDMTYSPINKHIKFVYNNGINQEVNVSRLLIHFFLLSRMFS